MSKRTRYTILAGAMLIAVIGTAWLLPQQMRFHAIDSCQDRGGSWHYDIGECSFNENYRSVAEPLSKIVTRVADGRITTDDADRIAKFQEQRDHARLRELGLGSAVIQERRNQCAAIQDFSMAECDQASQITPDDLDTVEVQPYCHALTQQEYNACLFGK